MNFIKSIFGKDIAHKCEKNERIKFHINRIDKMNIGQLKIFMETDGERIYKGIVKVVDKNLRNFTVVNQNARLKDIEDFIKAIIKGLLRKEYYDNFMDCFEEKVKIYKKSMTVRKYKKIQNS